MSSTVLAALLVGALVVLLGAVAVRAAQGIGLPGLLVFLALGLLLGEAGAGIRFDDAELARELGLLGLVIILAEGGLTTRWATLRPVLPVAAALSTVGVAVSVLVVAAADRLLLGAPWIQALILGAVLAPTDAAAVFSVLRRVRLLPRLGAALEAESGTNDPLMVLLVVALVDLAAGSFAGAGPLAVDLALEVGVGAVVGAGVGAFGAYSLRKLALPATGLYPLAVLALVLGSYAGAALLHGSGFLAIYLTSLILGNAELPHRAAVLGFVEGAARLAQIGLFVLLGLLASPARLGAAVVPALVIGAVLVLLARPLSVAISTLPFRLPLRQQGLLSWAGLRGAVPIVLTTIPLAAGVPGALRLFDVVFLLVTVLTVLQAPTIAPLARRLGLLELGASTDLDVDAAPLQRAGADLLSVRIEAGSRLHGVRVWQLRLAELDAALAMVVRAGRATVPDDSTMVVTGDELLVVAASRSRGLAEQRLRDVARLGVLDAPVPTALRAAGRRPRRR